MSRKIKKKLIIGLIITVLFSIVLGILCLLNYIDFSVISNIYLPIWVIAMLSTGFGKYAFGGILLLSSSIGLFAEYIIHISNLGHPSMKGAFLDTAIIIVGIIVSIVIECIIWSRTKTNNIIKKA
jgi:hypothetical protein